MISIERLHELFFCNYRTGILTRRVHASTRARAGSIAGRPDLRGYLRVTVDGEELLAHRIIFAMAHDRWPIEIDHKNHIPSDNRFANLREATGSQNKCNRRFDSRNTSGARGVYFDGARGRWVAQVILGRKKVFRKRFDSLDEAVAERDGAAAIAHGEFYITSTKESV